MGDALSRWIDGSLATLENIEAERDRQSAQLDGVRQVAASHRAAITELESEVAKLQEERKLHAEKLRELDEQIATQAGELDGLNGDIRTMTGALESVAQGDGIPTAVRKPVPKPKPKPSPTAKSQAAPISGKVPMPGSPVSRGGAKSTSAPPSPAKSSAAEESLPTQKRGPKQGAFATPSFVSDDLSESIDRVPRSSWRRVVVAGVALSIVGGAAFIAFETGLLTDVIDLGSVFR